MVLRIAALAIGYIFGLCQTGYLLGKAKGIDIREHGSGNTGATNSMRTLGKKGGAIAFLGDLLKSMLAIWLVGWIFKDIFDGDIKILQMYAGLGAVLGHNFPFYLKFKGGKGISCTAGVIIAICPKAVPICLLVFVLTVAISKYVSLGSILMVLSFITQVFIFNYNGMIGLESNAAVEFNFLTFIFVAMAIIRHRANIVRLANGTENKLGSKKTEKK